MTDRPIAAETPIPSRISTGSATAKNVSGTSDADEAERRSRCASQMRTSRLGADDREHAGPDGPHGVAGLGGPVDVRVGRRSGCTTATMSAVDSTPTSVMTISAANCTATELASYCGVTVPVTLIVKWSGWAESSTSALSDLHRNDDERGDAHEPREAGPVQRDRGIEDLPDSPRP